MLLGPVKFILSVSADTEPFNKILPPCIELPAVNSNLEPLLFNVMLLNIFMS